MPFSTNRARKKKPVIGIIGGTGRMGNWFKLFFEKNGLTVLVSGRKTTLTNKELAEKADIVIVSAPLKKTVHIIKEIRDKVRKDALLTDFTSLKTEPVKEMAKSSGAVLGMHPLFGPSVPNLSQQTIVFCRKRDNIWVEFLKNVFKKNGAKIVEISPQEHDRHSALTQAALHFHQLCYALVLQKKRLTMIPHALTPLFKLESIILGRIFSQKSEIYAAIEMENPYFIEILSEYRKTMTTLSEIVQKKDYRAFEEKFTKSQRTFNNLVSVSHLKSGEILKMLEKQPFIVGKSRPLLLPDAHIGFLGPKGTFSWLAAIHMFPKSKVLVPFSSIQDVCRAVIEKEACMGVVPLENSTTGIVSETIRSFVDNQVHTYGSFVIPIHHALASREKNIKTIDTVVSHPQALSQCGVWLATHLPKASRESAQSTTVAVSTQKRKGVAFILPEKTALSLKLNVLAKNIENNKENATRFLVIGNSPPAQIVVKKSSKTLLLVSVYDQPGILRNILSIFADKNINLSSLHSIRTPDKPWDYMFFLELEERYSSPRIASVLSELGQYCPYIRLIGAA